jgi:Zn-dependent protease with chaperone function
VLVLLAGGGHAASARPRLDIRIDALDARTLTTLDAPHLVDPVRQRRARAIADYRHVSSTLWAIAQIAALWLFWRNGWGARLRDTMRRRTRSKTAQRVVFGATLGLITAVAALPFAFASYRIGFVAGLTPQPGGSWFAVYLTRALGDALIGAFLVGVVLWLVDNVKAWYLYLAAGLYAFALAGVMVSPVLNGSHKSTPHSVDAASARVAGGIGLQDVPYVQLNATSGRSDSISIGAAGLFSTARIVLSDVDLVHFEPAELDAALANAQAHLLFHDTLRLTLFAVTLLVFSAALAVLASDRVGFRRDDDALSRLALVATFLGLVCIVTYPIYNAYARNLVLRADTVEREVSDRASVVRGLVRVADVNLVPLCDRRSIRWYFEDRPALGSRIARAAGTSDPCPTGLAEIAPTR